MKNTENNKLMAEFMGFKIPDPSNPDSLYSKNIKRKGTPVLNMMTGRRSHTTIDDKVLFEEGELMFNSSWDWLMPVVDKLESEGFPFTIWIEGVNVESAETGRDIVMLNLETFQKTSKIDRVYEAVVRTIKWYNENK